MYQNRFRLGLCPRPRWGALSAPPDLLTVRGLLLRGRRGGGREEGKGRGREGKRGRGRGGEGRGGGDLTHSLSQIPGYATAVAVYI